ncbi:unnamed protein product, partial [Owenia fusiformis]
IWSCLGDNREAPHHLQNPFAEEMGKNTDSAQSKDTKVQAETQRKRKYTDALQLSEKSSPPVRKSQRLKKKREPHTAASEDKQKEEEQKYHDDRNAEGNIVTDLGYTVEIHNLSSDDENTQ